MSEKRVTKPKGSSSYRLSDEAMAILTELSGRLGITKANVLDMGVHLVAMVTAPEQVKLAAKLIKGK